MSIKILEKAVAHHNSQALVARLLGITPQRLNNWLRAKKMPQGWEYGLEERLGLNGSNGTKRGKRSA